MRRGTGSPARAFFLLFWLLSPLPALAQMDVSPLTATSTINWTSGDVVYQATFCAESFNEAPDKKSSTPIPYSVNASIGGAATPFSLANGAGQTVPVTLAWTDLVTSGTTALSPAVPTAMTMTGKISACPGGNNGQLTITVLAAALGAASSGTYTRTFAVELANAGSGRTRRTANVTLTIVIPSSIRISNVSDFALGTFVPGSDLVSSDTLCVYRNTGALFSLVASGSGAGGAFTLANGALPPLPYAVTWQDSLGTLLLTAGTTYSGRGNAYNLEGTCGGGAANNVTVSVTVTAASLMSAWAGNYTGVLTLLVAPQ